MAGTVATYFGTTTLAPPTLAQLTLVKLTLALPTLAQLTLALPTLALPTLAQLTLAQVAMELLYRLILSSYSVVFY